MTLETAIESRARWGIHRKAVDSVRAVIKHPLCAIQIGMLAVERATGRDDCDYKPAPCARCLAIWQQLQQRKAAA